MGIENYTSYRKDVDFIKRYMQAVNAASGSEVDSNSNVSSKNIATMSPEIHKMDNICANRLWMHDRLTEMYGSELADEYIRQLESHEIYRHDETLPIGTPYCASITLYPFLVHGMTTLCGTSKPPHHLRSFLGGFINLVFAVASELCGAVATPEFLSYMDYFIRKEYGNDYYLDPDKVVNPFSGETLNDIITQGFEQVVYSLNQPAGARGFQSVFWNVAYFDRPYFESLFDGFAFPDGDTMQWDSVSWLQKRFMKWFNKERLKSVLTFPVESLSLLNDGKDYVDQEWADFAAEMLSEGHSFFIYTSDSVDSLASCCFAPSTKIVAKSSDGVHVMTIEELHNTKWKDKRNLTVYHNGSWVSAKTIALPADKQMYRITTANKKSFDATSNHIWVTLDGEKKTQDLTSDDWLMFNTRALDAVPEKDRKLTYAQGFLIGMYLGDGSADVREDRYYAVNYSLNENKYKDCISTMKQGALDCGIEKEFTLHKPYNNVFPVCMYSRDLYNFIFEHIEGSYANEKHMKPDVLLQSQEFRRGILDGLYATDGGNSNRIYTTSKTLAEDIEVLCTSLGINTIIDMTDRTNEPVVIREQSYKRNYPLYCIRWYNSCNKRSMTDIFKVVNNSVYFKVQSVEKIPHNYDLVYCFECDNEDEPYFTLPSGAITHNCRLRNGITENTFSYTLGAGGVSTGSKCVMTMNLNRLIQQALKEHDIKFTDYDKAFPVISKTVGEQVEKMHKYLLAFNSILMEMCNDHMIPIYDAGFVSPEKQYLTIGINGAVEAAQAMMIDISDNKLYKKFMNSILEPIYEANKAAKTKEIMFNTEFVPAENLGIKNAKWDKKDGFFVPRDCYNSYFYIVENEDTSPVDKFILHGRAFTAKLDGGQAVHVNMSEHLSKLQYAFLMRLAVTEGTPYFTFNVPNTICNDCGYISKHKLDKCPKCGSENLDYATRIIGYLTRVSKWSLGRQEEHKRRYYARGMYD